MALPSISPNYFNEAFNDVFDYFEKIKNRQAQQAQFAKQMAFREKEAERAGKQFQQSFGLQQRAAKRAEELQPYQIQQYKDAHDKANQLMPLLIQQYEDVHKEKMTKQQMDDAYNKIVMSALNESNAAQPNIEPPSQTGVMPPIGNERLPEPPPSTFGFAPQIQQQMGNNGLAINPNIPEVETPPVAPPAAGQTGEEIIVRPATNPKLKALDRIAGLKGSPVPAPSISHYQGYTYTRYPSGEIRAVKMSPNADTDVDKMQSTFGKAVADLQYIEKKFGREHPLYQQGLSFVKRVAEGTPGVELTVDPKTGAISFTQGTRGSAPKQQIVNGKLVNAPTTQTTSQQQAQQSSNVGRLSAFGASENPYIGRESNKEILTDYMKLVSGKLSPAEKKNIEDKLVKAAVALKMVPEIASLQLASQNVRATVPALRHQREAIMQGWPASLEWIVNNLPPEVQQRAITEHTNLLSKIAETRNQLYAQGFPIELKPGEGNAPVSNVQPDIDAQLKQLDTWADEAIAAGKNKELVKKKLAELKAQIQGVKK